MKKLLTAFFIIGFSLINYSQITTLIDFGENQSANIFSLSGWNTLLLAPEMEYSSAGPAGVNLTSNLEEFTDYMGVSGTTRQFSMGERIIVTWYNNSSEPIFFTSRISFNDTDLPNGGSSEGSWFTMRSFEDYRVALTEIPPLDTAKTIFNITDSGVHKSDEAYSSVNINIAIEWGESTYKQYLICDKIELANDADISLPEPPEGLSGEIISDSMIRLRWNHSTDNTGVAEYLIYNGDKVEGYTRENEYLLHFLEPDKEYNFKLTALDRAGNESSFSETLSLTTKPYTGRDGLINPSGIKYLGRFALPEEFSWGGEAIAYFPEGDPVNSGFYPGALFVTNLNQPENGLVGLLNIPEPLLSGNPNVATVLIAPINIRPANINNWEYVDIWRTGLEYYHPERALYSSWSIHYTVSGEKNASISCCSTDNLATSDRKGAWFLGNPNEEPIEAMANDYLFALPEAWASDNCNGRELVCGRFRDGGLSGLGPTLYAFEPVGNSPPVAESVLNITPLLKYGSVAGTDNYNYPNSIDDYNHSDNWKGADWISAGDQSAIAFVGLKGMGDNWYGYQGENMRNDWVFADMPYPDFYATDPDGKGWRAHNYLPMMILFNPNDLAKVANGTMEAHEPQPYAAFRFEGIYDIRAAAFDQTNGILYIAEFLYENDGQILIHLFDINHVPVNVERNEYPTEFKLLGSYPNPFNPSTNISFSLPERETVNIKIFNAIGEEIATVINKTMEPGEHTITFNAYNLPTGPYFYRIKAGKHTKSSKILLLK